MERRKRTNDEYAARATKRTEEWMAKEVDRKKMQDEPNQNPFAFEFRFRKPENEVGTVRKHSIP